MKSKIINLVFLGCLLLLSKPSFAGYNFNEGFDKGKESARGITVDTSNFSKNLSSSDTDIQHALETLDQLTAGGGSGSGTIQPGTTNLVSEYVGIGTTTIGPTSSLYAIGDNVGIGTAVPPNNLYVVGSTQITGQLKLSTSGFSIGTSAVIIGTTGTGTSLVMNTTPTFTTSIVDPLVAGGTGTASTLILEGTSSNSPTNASSITIRNTGGTGTAIAMTIDSASNIGLGTFGSQSGKLIIVGGVGIGTVLNGDSYISSVPPLGGMIIEKNVGIGSTAPGVALDVTGTVRATTFSGPGLISGLTANFYPRATSATTLGNSLTQDDGTNVGIGTVGPFGIASATRLSVAQTDGLTAIMVGNATTGRFALNGFSDGSWGMFDHATGAFVNSLTSKGGNVGIQNQSPIEVLSVGVSPGSSQTSGIGVMFNASKAGLSDIDHAQFVLGNSDAIGATGCASQGFAGKYTGTTYTLFAGIAGCKDNATDGNYSGYLSLRSRLSGGDITEAMRISPTGNVGIGSTNPQAALVIGGGGVIRSSGTAPTVALNDCGSTTQGTVNAGSTDMRGDVVVGTLAVTSCKVTLAGSYTPSLRCFPTDDTSLLTIRATETATTITFVSASSVSGDTISWFCLQ